MAQVITVQDTMPHVQQVFTESATISADVISQYKAENGITIGVSRQFFNPLRPGASFPMGYVDVMRALTDGRYAITSPDNHSPYVPLLGGEAIPHYMTSADMLYIPVASQFESDLTAWHALLHEAAHRAHLRPLYLFHRGMAHKMPTADVKESVADAAAYAALRAIGMPAESQKTALYINDWQQARVPWAIGPTTEELVWPAAEIAAGIANVYNRVMIHGGGYV